jgi:hypothetical protein
LDESGLGEREAIFVESVGECGVGGQFSHEDVVVRAGDASNDVAPSGRRQQVCHGAERPGLSDPVLARGWCSSED